MKRVVSASLMKESDSYTIKNITPSLELMKRAGDGVFSLLPNGSVAIVCGKGNNAGDGYVIALNLQKSGRECHIFLIEESFSSDGKHYFDMAKGMGVPVSLIDGETSLNGYDVIVDCIFGIGFTGEPSGKYKRAIEKINEAEGFVVSVDINSGLNADSGRAKVAVKSDLTVAIGEYKSGHFLADARDLIGSLNVIDIGILIQGEGFSLFEGEDASKILKKRKSNSHKGSYGYIALIGGSVEYSGAIKLANLGASALRTGAGVVRLACPKSIVNGVLPYVLESTIYQMPDDENGLVFEEDSINGAINGASTVAIGMGLGKGESKAKIVEYLLKSYEGNLIIDADGLNALSLLDKELIKNSRARLVLTPHPKEFSRISGALLNDLLNNPVAEAMAYAKKMGVTLLLKGNTTIVTNGEECVLLPYGTPGMATGGSGDVLSGVLAGVISSNDASLFENVCLGAYITAMAGISAEGELGEISQLPSDTIRHLPRVIKEIAK